MNKKLPNVFANHISKDSSHNKNISYTVGSDKTIEKTIKKDEPTIQNVNQKINDIFSSTRYVYKADVNITLKDGVIKRKIIGKNAVHLITIDNELIPIGDIIDIKFAD